MIDQSIRVLELPMMFAVGRRGRLRRRQDVALLPEEVREEGLRLNDRGEVGWIYFFSKNKVESIADLKEAEALDVGRRPARRRDVQEAEAQRRAARRARGRRRADLGKINACFSSPLGAVALQWYSKVKYMTSMPMSFAIGATVVSLDAVKKVSAEDQKTIEAIAKRSQKKPRKVIRKANEDARKTHVTQGHHGRRAAGGDGRRAHERSRARSRRSSIGKVYSKEELDMVIKYRDEYRAKHTKK